jgi:hypothetical protein
MMEESVHRDLQDDGPGQYTKYCDPSSPDFQYIDCDCTQFDSTTGTGDMTCNVYTNYCADAAKTLCFDYTVSGSFSADGTYTITPCQKLLSPYEQEVCYSTNRPIPNGCDITVDGETCNSCAETVYFSNSTEDYCLQFDCTNTAAMNEGSQCDGDTVFTILGEDEFICEICGPNSIVTNPDGVVSFPEQDDVTCSQLLAAGDALSLTIFGCLVFNAFITGPCECMDEGVVTPAPADMGTPAPAVMGTPAPVDPTAPVGVTPAPVETPSTPAPAPDPTAAPDGVSALLTTKNAMSLMGLSVAMLVHFAF